MAKSRGRSRSKTDGGPSRTEAQRMGPRPLPLHLTTAALLWGSSLSGWPLWKSGLLPWNASSMAQGQNQGQNQDEKQAEVQALKAALENLDSDAFQAALGRAVRGRLECFLDGVEAYRNHSFRRSLPEMPLLWQEGSSRLLDYAPGAEETAPAILFVPSLVNRYYVLDLDAETSFLRWLAGQGFKPLVIDWGAPGPEEQGFVLTDYVAGRLEAALDAARRAHSGPLHLAGYCMGGLLALALAQRRRRDLASLMLLATPWDFHAEQPQTAQFIGAQAAFLAPFLEQIGVMPTDMIQSYFGLLDPTGVLRKFLAFARLRPDSEKARRFVALEDWLNDGVPLAARVATECLSGWYGRNDPAAGRWRIAGHPVRPADLDLPVLALIPAQDRIVPPDSALALARALPGAEVQQPALGHIGMVVSARARERVWQPFAGWLAERS